MKRFVGHALAVGVTAVIAASAMPACTDNDMSVYVEGVLAPPQNRQNNQCVYTPDPQATQLFSGTLDMSARGDYTAVVLYANQMIPRGDPTQTRAESNRFHLDGAVVTVKEADGAVIHEFTSTAAGVAHPQNNNVPGYDIATVIMIDSQAIANIRAAGRALPRTVISTIRVFGRTLGGVEVESGDFNFPIRVCERCLINFDIGVDPAQPLPNCARELTTTSSSGQQVVIPCAPGQDESTPCQLCRGFPGCDP